MLTNPCELSPYAFQRSARMAAKPIAGKTVLADDHRQTDEDSIGNAQLVITGQSVAAEDGTADDGLQQVIGKTHTAEYAQVMEYTANALECIPRRYHY